MSYSGNQNSTEKPQVATVPAGFLIRASAHLIDLSILQAILWFVFRKLQPVFEYSIPEPFVALGLGGWPNTTLFLVSFISISIFVFLFYFIVTEASPLNASPGKLIFGLQVLTQSVRLVTFSRVVKRNIARLLCISTAGIGYFIAAVTRNRQGLHDLIARTIVVAHPYPRLLRPLFSLLAIGLFLAVSWHLPVQDTRLLRRTPAQLVTTIKNQAHDQTVKSLGSIGFNDQTTEFYGSYGRIDSLKLYRDTSQLRHYTRIQVAFYEEALTAREIQALHYESDFFDDPLKTVGKTAVLIVSLSYPEELIRCDSSSIAIASIKVNPALISNSKLKSKSLYYKLKASDLALDSRIFTDCRPNLTDKADIKLTFQETLPSTSDTPKFTVSLNTLTTMHMQSKLPSVTVNHLAGSIAFWYPQQERLEVGLYNDELSPALMGKIISQRALYAPDLPAPAAIVSMQHKPFIDGSPAETFAVDLVKRYKITFHRQVEGLLKFKDDLPELIIEHEPGVIPNSLTGRMVTGERLTGRVAGTKRLNSSSGLYNFVWDLPFNAPVVVVDQ